MTYYYLEKLVYNSTVDFITNSISVNQFGFLRGRSTLQQLLIFFNTILSSSSQKDVIYLDYRKAFDSVAHNELLYKLWNFGITGTLWLWVRAYLTNRVQYVSIGQSSSTTLPVLSGVPQGSVLGPLLFLIFVNDLPTTLSFSKVLLFADDAKCIMPISSLQDCIHLQSDLSRVSEWCNTVFSGSVSVSAKCSLYTSLVRSQLLYCSPVWHPYLLRDIRCLEQVQRRATKFVTNNPVMDYRNRLIHLKLLPLIMEYEIADIMFLVKSIKFPSDHFRFCDYVQFCSHPTRGSSNLKLKHSLCWTEIERNFYFNRIPRLWNSLPTLDINLPLSVIKSGIRQFFWNHFVSNFDSNNVCTYHYLCPCVKCSKLPVNMHFGLHVM